MQLFFSSLCFFAFLQDKMQDSRDQTDTYRKAEGGVDGIVSVVLEQGKVCGNRGFHGAVERATGDHGNQSTDVKKGSGRF